MSERYKILSQNWSPYINKRDSPEFGIVSLMKIAMEKIWLSEFYPKILLSQLMMESSIF